MEYFSNFRPIHVKTTIICKERKISQKPAYYENLCVKQIYLTNANVGAIVSCGKV